MSKKPIWLDEFEMEVIGGYLAEMLDENENGELPDYAREAIHNAFEQMENTDFSDEEEN
jgi:hypothetical protein